MKLRPHIYGLLKNDTDLKAAVHDTLLERGSFEVTPAVRPFLVYRFGIQRAEPRWSGPRRLELVVFVHDDVGDYGTIDDTLDLVDLVLLSAPSSNDGSGFVACNFVERSEDFQDDKMNTFYRFSRYQVVTA